MPRFPNLAVGIAGTTGILALTQCVLFAPDPPVLVPPPHTGASVAMTDAGGASFCDGSFRNGVTFASQHPRDQVVGTTAIKGANVASVRGPAGFSLPTGTSQTKDYTGQLSDPCKNGAFTAFANPDGLPANTYLTLALAVDRQEVAVRGLTPPAPAAAANGSFTVQIRYQCCAWAAAAVPAPGAPVPPPRVYRITVPQSQNISGNPNFAPAAWVSCPAGGGPVQTVTMSGRLADAGSAGRVDLDLNDGSGSRRCAHRVGIGPVPGG